MTVPFLDLAAQHAELADELSAALQRVLLSGRYVLGPETAAFEQEIAVRCGAATAIGVSSGTDALMAAMLALRIGPGDRVLTSPYSFISTATAIRRLGATPVFADIDPETYNLDPKAVAEWFETHRWAAHTVKAILPVHLYGQCADLATLNAIARERRIPIIEDAAQAIGATFAGTSEVRHAGTVGVFGCLSFYPTKNLGAAGEAGLVFTNDLEHATRIRQLRNQGLAPSGQHPWIGGNFRMDEMQAALLRVKLKHLTGWTARRRALADRYDRALAEVPLVTTPKAAGGAGHHAYHQYVIRLDTDRDRVRTALAARGIETRVYYSLALHEQPCLRDLNISPDAYPHALAAARGGLALPIHPFLLDVEQDRVIEALRDEVAA